MKDTREGLLRRSTSRFRVISYLSILVFALFFLVIPNSHFALGFGGVDFLVLKAHSWVQTVIIILVSLAFLFFLFGLVRVIASAGNPDTRKDAVQVMIFGIISLFVIVSVWGLVAILQNSTGVNTGPAQVYNAPIKPPPPIW